MPPKKGYKQTPEHIAKRIVRGPKHWAWKGESASRHAGHLRAEHLYKDIGPCSRCGNPKSERHHKDGNTHNNEPSNIEVLCRRCHQIVDGRMEKFTAKLLTVNGYGRSIATAKAKAATHCKRGHPLSGDNLLLQKHGTRRLCKACIREAQKRWVQEHPERFKEIQQKHRDKVRANSSTPTSA